MLSSGTFDSPARFAWFVLWLPWKHSAGSSWVTPHSDDCFLQAYLTSDLHASSLLSSDASGLVNTPMRDCLGVEDACAGYLWYPSARIGLQDPLVMSLAPCRFPIVRVQS